MSLTIAIFIAIIVQMGIYYKNRLAAAIAGFCITTGVLVYGLYLYNNTYYIIKFRGMELNRELFISLMVIWYIVDFVHFIKAWKPQKKEGSIGKETSEAPLEAFLGIQNRTLFWPRIAIFLIGIIIVEFIPMISGFRFFYYDNIPLSPLHYILTIVIFMILNKKNIFLKITITSFAYGIFAIVFSFIWNLLSLKDFSFDLLLYWDMYEFYWIAFGKKTILFCIAYSFMFLIIAQVILVKIKWQWLAAFSAVFAAYLIKDFLSVGGAGFTFIYFSLIFGISIARGVVFALFMLTLNFPVYKKFFSGSDESIIQAKNI